MGWWKIKGPENGQIDWTAPKHTASVRGINDVPGLINAIPGRDTVENYYNGDSVADTMDAAIEKILKLCGKTRKGFGRNKPIEGISRQDMMGLFLNLKVSENFNCSEGELIEIVNKTWINIIKQWQESWGRNPYPEERQGVCSFCINPLFE